MRGGSGEGRRGQAERAGPVIFELREIRISEGRVARTGEGKFLGGAELLRAES
jgi:hypothetical protein